VTPAPRPFALRLLTFLNLLALALLLFSVLWRKVMDFDIWWHLASGQWILEHRSIPRVDMFSFTRAGHEWIDLHWLFQVIVYGLYHLWGAGGLIFGQMVWITLAWLLVASIPGLRRTPILTMMLFALGIVAGNSGYLIRPLSLSLVFLALTLAVLWRWHQNSSRLLYLLPFTQALWTNSHSLFALGLFLIGCFFAEAGLFAFWRGRTQPQAWTRFRQISLVLGLSVLAGLLNPYGLRGLLFPYQLFLEVSGRFGDISRYTSEFRPPLAGYVASAHIRAWEWLLGLSALSFVLNWRRLRLSLLLAWLGFAYLSWIAIRNLTPFGLVAAPLAALNFGEWFTAQAPRLRAALPEWLRQAAIGLLGLALLLAQAAFADYVFTDRYFAETWIAPSGVGIEWSQYPRGAAEFLAREKIPGLGFNTFEEGNYLIWRLFPEYEVFIDGRQEVSGPEFFHRYAQIVTSPRQFPELTSEYPLRFALLGHKSVSNLPLMTWFSTNPNFALVFLDSVAAVFVLRSAVGADWLKEHEIVLQDIAPVPVPELPRQMPRWRERYFTRMRVPLDAYYLAQLYKWLKLPNLALAEYRNAVAESPRLVDAWAGIAGLLQGQGRVQESIPYLDYCLRLDPEHDTAHSMMATALQARDPDAALRHLLALRRLRPNDHRTHNDLAVFYLQRGQAEQALREMEIARQDPYGRDDPTLDLNQALVYMTLNQPRNAEPYLRRYLAAVPDDVKAHFLLGQLLWQLGQRAEAKPNLDFAHANHFRPPGGMTYPDEFPERP